MDWRWEKKRREAIGLRDVPPEESLLMGFRLSRFAKELADATKPA